MKSSIDSENEPLLHSQKPLDKYTSFNNDFENTGNIQSPDKSLPIVSVPLITSQEPPTNLVKGLFLVSSAFLSTLLLSGVIFGYSGLYPILAKEEKAFADQCPKGTTEFPCNEQNLQLALMFTIGAATVSGSGIFAGIFLDRYGPKITTMVSCFIFLAGLVIFAFAKQVSSSFYFIGFFLISLAGPSVFIAVINFGDIFPNYSSAIIGAICGAFDASAGVLFFWALFVKWTNLTLKTVLLSYCGVPIFFFAMAAFFYPNSPYGAAVEPEEPLESDSDLNSPPPRALRASENRNNLKSGDLPSEILSPPRARHAQSPEQEGELGRLYNYLHHQIYPPTLKSSANLLRISQQRVQSETDSQYPHLYNTSFWHQLFSLPFLTVTVVTAFLVLRLNYFIAIVPDFLETLTSASTTSRAASMNDIFNYVLPGVGLASIPVVGWVLVRIGFTGTYLLIVVLNLAYSSTVLYHNLMFQISTFVIFAAVRPFIFSALSAFIGEIYGFANYGKLYGTSRLVASVVTCLQYLFVWFVQNPLDGNYFWVDVGLAIFSLSLLVYPLYLWKGVFFGVFLRPRYEQ